MSKEETEIALLKQSHQNLMDKIEEILVRFDKFEEKLDCALEKKADKTAVEKIQDTIRWVSYLIIGGVITGLLALIIKH